MPPFSLAVLISIFFSSLVFGVEIPRSQTFFNVEPGLIGKSISDEPTQVLKKSQGISHIQEPKLEAASQIAEAEKISFVLNEVIFSGNHAFSNEELQILFKPYIRKKITLAQLIKLVQQVTDKYQKAGYFLSKAILPPQEIKNGVVKIRILEGFISNVKIQGVKNWQRKVLMPYGESIKSIKPIRLADLERYLLLLNDIPGFQVKSVIAPDPKVPLGSMLTLVTQYTPVQAAVTYDNYQTLYLGPYETTAYASLNSVLLPGGTLYARALSANQSKKLQFYELKHDQTLGSSGLIFTLDTYYTQTNPHFILAPLEIFGYSGDGNANLSYPIIRSRDRSWRILGQFDYMDNHSLALGQLLYFDRIRDFTLASLYTDNLWKGEDAVTLALDKGFNIFGAHAGGLHSRPHASSDFFKIDLTASRNQPLNNVFSLFGLVTAQYSNKPLLAAEQFIFGGPYLGRGYDWAQFTGDQGVAGKVEFRFNTTNKLPILKSIQYYAFYDAGVLWNYFPSSRFSGTSTGLGLRTAVMPHINFEGFLGKPLTTPNATQVILNKNGKAFLGFFQITAYL